MPAYLYESRVPMYATDAAGVVYFASYFLFAEEAETRAMASLGAVVTRDGHLYPRVHVEADYRAPLRFFDAYRVEAGITRIGSSSAHWLFCIRNEAGECCAIVRAVSARRHLDNSPAPYSEEEKNLLSRLLCEDGIPAE